MDALVMGNLILRRNAQHPASERGSEVSTRQTP
jgi:hypothetical protein